MGCMSDDSPRSRPKSILRRSPQGYLVIAAEIHRRNGGWKIRAVSQGFHDLAGLIAVFGVETTDDTTAPTPRSPGR